MGRSRLAESLALADGYQTTDANAQKLEDAIHRLHEDADEDRTLIIDGIHRVAAKLAELNLGFDDWQVIYRKLLQLDRFARGLPQMLETTLRRPPEEHPVI